MKHAHQRGVALLVAIVIFAMATTIAAAITYNKTMAARRAAATFTMEQALQAGMAAEALAAMALEADGSKATTNVTQDWAQVQPPIEIEGTGIWIQAQVEDLQGRFNLNSMVMWDVANNTFVADPHQVEVFRNLLQQLDIDVRYADLLVDWIDPDIAPYGNSGGEDTLYMSQNPTYRPPNTFITHPSELLALPGFGREAYAKIAPYVTALPNDVPVNICTASGQVLEATLNDPTNQQYATQTSQNMTQSRQNGCWPTKSVYTGVISNPQNKAEVEKRVEEKSSWFRLRTNIRIGTAEFVLYSVLFREAGNKIRTVQRSFGSE